MKVRTIGFGLAQTFIDRISNQLNRHMHIWSTSFQQSCQSHGKKIISSKHGALMIGAHHKWTSAVSTVLCKKGSKIAD